MQRPPTIQDVAREAGVAVGTVSNVLNGHPYVSEETRAKVTAAVKRLGYRRNSLAGGLRSRSTMTLGLLLPTLVNPFYPALARGVEDVARENGYTVVLCNTDRDHRREQGIVQTLLEKRVDGIIAVSPGTAPQHLLPANAAPPLVVVEGGSVEAPPCDMVTLQAQSGIDEAARHLRSLGHRRIGMIRGPAGVARADERADLWRAAAARHGLELAHETTVAGDFSFAGGERGGRELLVRSDRPSAIVAANDLMALGAMKAAWGLGLAVPRDVSIVGFDDIDAASYVTPALTSVAVPAYEQGAEAVRLLLSRMAAKAPPPVRVCALGTRLLVRASTGTAPEGA